MEFEEKILFLFCNNCKLIPLIKFDNLENASLSCNCCQQNQQMTYEEIFVKFFSNIKQNNIIIDYFVCNIHNDIFKFYCENCGLNLCEKCQEEHGCPLRFKINLKIFNPKLFEVDEFLTNLDETFISLKKVISFLFKQYQKYPHYNIRQNIISMLNLFLFDNIKNESASFEILNLSNKQLIHITFLVKKDLTNLKELNLRDNKLNNEQIPILKKLNCSNLEILNLESNFFTSYSLFTSIEKFTKLKEVNFSSNRLYEDCNILKNKIISYSSIVKLNLSNGVFSEDTINLLFHLKFLNLEYLDLSSNNLSSLSFLLKINFGKEENKIKKLIALNNDFFPINAINEYIDYLISNYANLELLILEEEYPIEYIEKNNLKLLFKIICYDENKNCSYLIDEYEKNQIEIDIRLTTLFDYQLFFENKAG